MANARLHFRVAMRMQAHIHMLPAACLDWRLRSAWMKWINEGLKAITDDHGTALGSLKAAENGWGERGGEGGVYLAPKPITHTLGLTIP